MAYSSHFSCINNGEKKQIVPFNLRREKNVSTALVRVLCRCECEWVCYVTNNATFYSHSFNIQYCTWLFIYFIIFFFLDMPKSFFFSKKKSDKNKQHQNNRQKLRKIIWLQHVSCMTYIWILCTHTFFCFLFLSFFFAAG